MARLDVSAFDAQAVIDKVGRHVPSGEAGIASENDTADIALVPSGLWQIIKHRHRALYRSIARSARGEPVHGDVVTLAILRAPRRPSAPQFFVPRLRRHRNSWRGADPNPIGTEMAPSLAFSGLSLLWRRHHSAASAFSVARLCFGRAFNIAFFVRIAAFRPDRVHIWSPFMTSTPASRLPRASISMPRLANLKRSDCRCRHDL